MNSLDGKGNIDQGENNTEDTGKNKLQQYVCNK